MSTVSAALHLRVFVLCRQGVRHFHLLCPATGSAQWSFLTCSLFQGRQACGQPLFSLEDVRALACACTRLQLMALLPDALLHTYAAASTEAAEMLHIFGRMPPLLASLPAHDAVNVNPAFPQPGGDWAQRVQHRPMRLLFVVAWPMADTQWRHIVDDGALMHLHTAGLLNEAMAGAPLPGSACL